MRMMRKWGYQAGTGLGKRGAGIVAPLVHERTGRRSGIIRQGDLSSSLLSTAFRAEVALAPPPLPAAAALQPAPRRPPPSQSRVLLLCNAVLPSGVDDELENEVRGECERLAGGAGEGAEAAVEDVIVFVAERLLDADGSWRAAPEHEAVRVFVSFATAAAADSCRLALDGRHFGGRKVAAELFDEERFRSLELG